MIPQFFMVKRRSEFQDPDPDVLDSYKPASALNTWGPQLRHRNRKIVKLILTDPNTRESFRRCTLGHFVVSLTLIQ